MTSRRPGAHPHATRLVHLGRKAPDSKACARGPWSARSFRFTPTSQPRRLVSALQPWLPCRSVSPFPWSAPSRARRATCAPRRFPPARPVSPLVSPPAPCSASTDVPCARSRHRRRAQIERTRGSLGHRPDRGMPPGARLPGLPDSDRTPRPRRSYPTNIPRRFMFFPLTRRVRSRPSARSSASAHAHPSAFACSSATSLNPAFLHPTPHARSAG